MNIEISGSPNNRGYTKAREFYKNLKAVILVVTFIFLIFLGIIYLFELPDDSNKNKVSQVQDALETYKPENLQVGEYVDIEARLATAWKVALGGAGVALFGLLGAGFIGTQLTLGLAAWADYVVGAALESIAAGITSYGAYNGWHWGGAAGEDGKRRRGLDDTFADYIEIDGVRIFNDYPSLEFDTNHELIGTHFNSTLVASGLDSNRILSVSYFETYNVDNRTDSMINKRDDGNNTDATLPSYSFTYNHTAHLIGVAVPVMYLDEALDALAAYVDGSSKKLAKRSGSTWVSYSVYGENTNVTPDIENNQQSNGDGFESTIEDWFSEQVQPCTSSYLCYAVAQKGCLAMSKDSTLGENSGIVGEFYTDSYGGIDGQCDSG